MELVNVLSMTAGNQECSYAHNSSLQKNVILGSKNVLDDTIKNYGTEGFSECLNVADLGCSCGPTAFLSVTNIINSVHAVCQEKNLKAPNEFQVFLNDLPNNDFNALFKTAPTYVLKPENENGCKKPFNYYIYGVAGSFYTRLFPSKSLHLVHSSYGVHWLSQVPEKLLDSNKGNVYLAKESPPGVYGAYFHQFKKDFTTFLRMRSVEMIPDGRMVLTLIGKNPVEDYCVYDLLAKSLQDMLVEGLLLEDDINSFNLPLYHPCTNELEALIKSESSFSIDRLETFKMNLDMRTEDEIIKSGERSGKYIAKILRAVMEPVLASHFGNNCVDKLFERYAVHASEQLSRTKIESFNIVISLTRKCKN
nr:PREDICTED: benzoate carboxyl methyltransferase-like [Daucus carota subsp. sativus]